MFGIRLAGRCSVSMTRQIQPRSLAFYSSGSNDDKKEPSEPKTPANTAAPEPLTPFQQRSAGRGQMISKLKESTTGGFKKFIAAVSTPEELKSAAAAAKSVSSPPKAADPSKPVQGTFRGPPRGDFAGRDNMDRPRFSGPGNRSSSPSRPAESKFKNFLNVEPPAGERAPKVWKTSPFLEDRISPPLRLASKNRIPQPLSPLPSDRRLQAPGARSPARPTDNRFRRPWQAPRVGGPAGTSSQPPRFGREASPFRRGEGSQKDGIRRPRRPRDSRSDLVADSIFDEPERAEDGELTMEQYMSKESGVHPLGVNDYYTPKERLPFKAFRLPEDEEFDYPTLEESQVFAGAERFNAGEVAHHGIDWANFDKIERISNEKYYVNIEPLHEANTSQFKTPEEFLASIPKTHEHYRTLVEVYTMVDRNPWYNDAQKINLLMRISKEGVLPA